MVPDLPALAAYLEQAGWVLEDDDGRTSLWRQKAPGSGRKLQIVLPVTQEMTDWPQLATAAINTLAFSQRRLPEEIAEDISYGGADNVAVRLTPDAPSGQAPLSLARSAVSALHSYVVASASALQIPDAVLPSHRPAWAESYASKVRLGTHPGSFVLSLALPLVADGGPPAEPADYERAAATLEQPFGRRVADRMLTAAQNAQQLAEEVVTGHLTVSDFGELALSRAMTNATELAALRGLGGSESYPYQIRFAQSPLASDRKEPVSLRITPEQQHVLAGAADFLRAGHARTS
jgi:hypothetical protein